MMMIRRQTAAASKDNSHNNDLQVGINLKSQSSSSSSSSSPNGSSGPRGNERRMINKRTDKRKHSDIIIIDRSSSSIKTKYNHIDSPLPPPSARMILTFIAFFLWAIPMLSEYETMDQYYQQKHNDTSYYSGGDSRNSPENMFVVSVMHVDYDIVSKPKSLLFPSSHQPDPTVLERLNQIKWLRSRCRSNQTTTSTSRSDATTTINTDNGSSPAGETKATTANSSSSWLYDSFKCQPTAQIRIVQTHPKWTLQTLDIHGQEKRIGGDEFYISYYEQGPAGGASNDDDDQGIVVDDEGIAVDPSTPPRGGENVHDDDDNDDDTWGASNNDDIDATWNIHDLPLLENTPSLHQQEAIVAPPPEQQEQERQARPRSATRKSKAVAWIVDRGDGTYQLDFVESPANRFESSITSDNAYDDEGMDGDDDDDDDAVPPVPDEPIQEQSSNNATAKLTRFQQFRTKRAERKERRKERRRERLERWRGATGGGGGGGWIQVHLQYTCGMGMYAPPMKDRWSSNGAILTSYEQETAQAPPIRPFIQPTTATSVSRPDSTVDDATTTIAELSLEEEENKKKRFFFRGRGYDEQPKPSDIHHGNTMSTTADLSTFDKVFFFGDESLQRMALASTSPQFEVLLPGVKNIVGPSSLSSSSSSSFLHQRLSTNNLPHILQLLESTYGPQLRQDEKDEEMLTGSDSLDDRPHMSDDEKERIALVLGSSTILDLMGSSSLDENDDREQHMDDRDCLYNDDTLQQELERDQALLSSAIESELSTGTQDGGGALWRYDDDDHLEALESYLRTVLERYPEVTCMWRSPIALHSHQMSIPSHDDCAMEQHVGDSDQAPTTGTKQSNKEACRKDAIPSLRYVSNSRLARLVRAQRQVVHNLHKTTTRTITTATSTTSRETIVTPKTTKRAVVPFLDLYQATYLSSDWALPSTGSGDGIQYDTILNAIMLSFFYENDQSNERNIATMTATNDKAIGEVKGDALTEHDEDDGDT